MKIEELNELDLSYTPTLKPLGSGTNRRTILDQGIAQYLPSAVRQQAD
jgi:hypothetical protein